MTTLTTSVVAAVPAADPDTARRHFAGRLAVECDAADVAADIASGRRDYTVIDTRSRGAFQKAHLPGAVHLPPAEMTPERVAQLADGLIITYCWGPGCNGATKGALRLAELGRQVKEMIGGFEYWVREGHPVEGRARGKLAYARDEALVG